MTELPEGMILPSDAKIEVIGFDWATPTAELKAAFEAAVARMAEADAERRKQQATAAAEAKQARKRHVRILQESRRIVNEARRRAAR